MQILIDRSSCDKGTPEGKRMSIATGEVKGIIDIQRAKLPPGDSEMGINNMIVNNNGTVIGSVNCWESVSLSAAEPTAAKSAE